MHSWLLLILFISSTLAPVQLQSAQQENSVVFTDVGAFFNFGQEVTFQLKVNPPEQVEHLFLFLQPEGQSTRVEPVTLTENGEAIYTYDAARYPLRPFARTYYWFRAGLKDGSEVESDRYYFDYIDNRFTWRTLEDSPFQVNWYDGDLSFAQDAANAAQAGLSKINQILLVDVPDRVDIYVYKNAADLQQALQISQQSWIAGHASPDLAVVLVSIPAGPDHRLEMERQIPHELAHVLEYQLTEDKYERIPVWLLEGSASLAELYPNSDYERVLKNAVEKDLLLPMNSICSSFPREASGAFLAYAQSASFVNYLKKQYGASGLLALFEAYSTGLGCDEGAQKALGTTLTQLEQQWRRAELGMDTGRVAFQNLSPYLLILMVILLAPFALVLFTRPKRQADG